MKRDILILLSFLLVVFILPSCEEELQVENTNQPTFEEVNLPSQVNGAVGGLFNNWYLTATDYNGTALPFYMAADAGSCSWGNAGMQDFSSEPRAAFVNDPGYPNMVTFETYYNNMYATLSTANDALKAIKNRGDEPIEELGRAKAVAHFIQGVTLGSIGLTFDQGFVVSEHTDLTEDVPVQPYDVLIDTAIANLNKAIQICQDSTFTIPNGWVPTVPDQLNNVTLGELANTMAARILTYSSRNTTQDDANDWEAIRDYASNGISRDFTINNDGSGWYNLFVYYANIGGWGRIDMRIINMMDEDMPPWFPASGDPQDLPNAGQASSDDARLESDFEYVSSQDFSPERGIYHFTTYRYQRHDPYVNTGWVPVGPTTYIRKAENDMLLAEALVHTGNPDGAKDILNDPENSRKARGGLADVTTDDTDELLEIIYEEKTIECLNTTENTEFYDMRRKGLDQEGTPKHLPIPAPQLEVLTMDIYTFGGSQGEPDEDVSTGGWEETTDRPNY